MRVSERFGLVAKTAVITSLAWILGLGAFVTTRIEFQREGSAKGTPLSLIGQSPRGSQGFPSFGGPGGQLIVPVAGVARTALVDTFTQARAGGARVHDAIDIMAPRGTPVIAAAAGRIERLFLSHDGGNTIYVRLRDGGGLHYYAHLDSYAPGLAEGQTVSAGAVLGTVGSSGNANPDAPHLHFAIMAASPQTPWYRAGPPINPYPLLTGKGGRSSP